MKILEGERMRVVVTGSNGMLGAALCPELERNKYTVYATDLSPSEKNIDTLDVRDFQQVNAYLKKMKPHLIMHLAAATDVDKCEKEKDYAYLSNVIGTQNMAMVCQEQDITMVYISTAAVFNGEKQEPYTELDQPDPVNVYAKTKLEGEKIVQKLLRKYFIIRAGWMMGGGKKDKKFVAKIIRLLEDSKEISVVADKFGSPTFTNDISGCLLDLIETKQYGLYHIANNGTCSRYDIAVKIAEYLGKKDVMIKPVSSSEFPLPAPRGRSEMLCNYKLKQMGMDNMPHWEVALKKYILELKQSELTGF